MTTDHLKYSNFSWFLLVRQIFTQFIFVISTQQLPVFSICNWPTVPQVVSTYVTTSTQKITYIRGTLNPGLEPHQCLYMFRYVDWNSSAAMLAVKMSAGVGPEVNLRNPLCTGETVCTEVQNIWMLVVQIWIKNTCKNYWSEKEELPFSWRSVP